MPDYGEDARLYEPNQYPYPRYLPRQWAHAMVIRSADLCIDALRFYRENEASSVCQETIDEGIASGAMDFIADDSTDKGVGSRQAKNYIAAYKNILELGSRSDFGGWSARKSATYKAEAA
ncbi:hypothetical protein [Variovorax sp. J22R115]|uniref:hypothetical protein n=1 Tax=Variovorax sp. J22R115 TaxID=3053509 RepID=UPI002574E2CB|nr:hypothetical protein [Variovorax sp. J22R115]MDM0048988.1 hypothetical protein [Variovorax sp. J22R115]